MANTLCKVCNKVFTRKWNLERHLQDIHKQYNKPESHGINSESKNHDSWQRYENSDRIFEQRHNYDSMNQINDSGRYHNFNNFPQYYPYPEYIVRVIHGQILISNQKKSKKDGPMTIKYNYRDD